VKQVFALLFLATGASAARIPVSGSAFEEGGNTISTPSLRMNVSGTDGVTSVRISFYGLAFCCNGGTFYADWSSGGASINDVWSESFSFSIHNLGTLTLFDDNNNVLATAAIRGFVRPGKQIWDNPDPQMIRDYTQEFAITPNPEPATFGVFAAGLCVLWSIRRAMAASR
jgi:hypothetical protein